jgi:hypothetical protein
MGEPGQYLVVSVLWAVRPDLGVEFGGLVKAMIRHCNCE